MHTLAPFRNVLIVATGLLLLAAGPPARADFIPIEDLFRSYESARVSLSPNGRYLAGERWEEVRSDDWRLLTFTFDLDERTPLILSDGENDFITNYAFASDERLVLGYLGGRASLGRRVVSGMGGWRAVNADGSDLIELIPTSERARSSRHRHPNSALVYARLLTAIPRDPEHIIMRVSYIGIHRRNALREDSEMTGRAVYRLNTRTGEATRIAVDTKVALAWWLDREGEVALSRTVPSARLDKNGHYVDRDWSRTQDQKIYLVEDGRQTKRLPIEPGPVTSRNPLVFANPFFSKDRKTLYFRSQSYTDRVAIVGMDVATGEVEIIHEHPEADIERIYFNRFTGDMFAYTVGLGKGEVIYTDADLASVMARVNASLPGTVNYLAAFDRERRRFLIRSVSGEFPTISYLLDVDAGRLEEVFNPTPWLIDYTFSLPRPIEFAARDGERIHGYLTLPVRAGLSAPYPMILLVHGGPWLRDHWRFDPEVQFLADRGYAVLQVNFRGSPGYGMRFMELSKRQFGKTMQDDLTDAVHWAIEEGYADPGRVGISGGSYGGYAAMAGVAFRPDLYRVGIAFAGVFDLTRQISDYRHYGWDHAEAFWKEWVGDAEEDRQALRAVSPMFHTDAIKVPVFLYHGYRDQAARVNQAFDFVRALRNSRVEFTRIYRREEGHGIFSEENRTAVYGELEDFLRKHMPSDALR